MGQGTFEQIELKEDTLKSLAKSIITEKDKAKRLASCDEFTETLDKVLKLDNSFDYPFDSLVNISIQYPQDSTFRIFTWQLFITDKEYKYYGILQMNNPKAELYPLTDESIEIEDLEYEILSPGYWYGSLYYNIKQFDTKEGRQYLLFGFDAFSFFDRRKIIDVLSFEDGRPTFGAPVFAKEQQDRAPIITNRIVKQYTAEAAYKLNYFEDEEAIIVPHLIPMQGYPEQGTTYVPDGSYEGYKLKDGLWVHVDKMYHHTFERGNPPRPYPVLDKPEKQGKDIFGKEITKKKKKKKKKE